MNQPKKDIVVLVCGGRDYAAPASFYASDAIRKLDLERVAKQRAFLFEQLDRVHKARRIVRLVSGHAKGADQAAEEWARERNVQISVFPAQWDKYGKRAGYLRNKQMLDENPDIHVVIAFPGGRGTANMVHLAEAKGVSTWHPAGSPTATV